MRCEEIKRKVEHIKCYFGLEHIHCSSGVPPFSVWNCKEEEEAGALTHSWMYCNRNGEARRLSTGQSKKPWISFWCRSMVITWFSPERHIIFATSFETMQPLLRILPAFDSCVKAII